MREDIFWEGIKTIEAVLGKEFTDDQSRIYSMLLNDIPEENFINGINTMLRERVYSNLPMPADIRKYCLETREEDLDIRVATARNKIKKAMNSIGTYVTVAFDDPIIHLVIRDFGGWIKLGMTDMEEFENLLKWDLPRLYKAYATRKNADIPLMLEGKADDKTVKYIGNEEKARRWILSYQQKIERLENKPENQNGVEAIEYMVTSLKKSIA
ncbi:DUF6475 domain-containing protein [Fusobacterium ulcerans]|uniref:DUF6475 domain-containing protein n=1 Tax=Fusobacterium ulcerans 12-1B TaxID=457404 RepID=H1PVQ0_9FUSO|nr:DUF6475 domain-containing protein [Fusobacterium ulcerans]EHO79754.1 hypothetical protein HMPREF0402_02493 [Fusobacterium ulcerans 12-1B]